MLTPGRRIGHVLAEELFANEESACGGRGLIRLGSQGKEERLSEESRTFRGGGERDAIEIVGRRLDTVDTRQVAVGVALGGGEDPREIAVVPDQARDEAARFLRHRKGGVRRELREGAAFLGGGEHAVEAEPLG